MKERADVVTRQDHGRGVEKLIERILETDLRDINGQLTRHNLLLGHRQSGDEVRLVPYDCNVLIAGPSGSGKSTVSKSLLERLQEQKYQFCIIDPEGDYEGLEGAVTVGSSKSGPSIDETLQLMQKPDTNVIINLVGLALADRPPFFRSLLPRLQEMRGRIGRPHWIVIDETHHLMPAAWEPGKATLPRQFDRMVFLTVHPEQIVRDRAGRRHHVDCRRRRACQDDRWLLQGGAASRTALQRQDGCNEWHGPRQGTDLAASRWRRRSR